MLDEIFYVINLDNKCFAERQQWLGKRYQHDCFGAIPKDIIHQFHVQEFVKLYEKATFKVDKYQLVIVILFTLDFNEVMCMSRVIKINRSVLEKPFVGCTGFFLCSNPHWSRQYCCYNAVLSHHK